MRGNLSNDIVSIKIEEGSKRPIALHEKSLFGKIEADTLNPVSYTHLTLPTILLV